VFPELVTRFGEGLAGTHPEGVFPSMSIGVR